MKIFYLTGSIILTVLLLILSFENIGSQCSGLLFFFTTVESGPTITLMGMAVLGIITGAFYHAFIGKITAAPEDDDGEENL